MRIDYIPAKSLLLRVWQALYGGGVHDFKEMNRRSVQGSLRGARKRFNKSSTATQEDITMKPIAAMPTPLNATNQTAESTNELQEQIRRRAHELYEQRSRVDGFASDDWFQAEAEILGAQKQPNAKAAKASK